MTCVRLPAEAAAAQINLCKLRRDQLTDDAPADGAAPACCDRLQHHAEALQRDGLGDVRLARSASIASTQSSATSAGDAAQQHQHHHHRGGSTDARPSPLVPNDDDMYLDGARYTHHYTIHNLKWHWSAPIRNSVMRWLYMMEKDSANRFAVSSTALRLVREAIEAQQRKQHGSPPRTAPPEAAANPPSAPASAADAPPPEPPLAAAGTTAPATSASAPATPSAPPLPPVVHVGATPHAELIAQIRANRRRALAEKAAAASAVAADAPAAAALHDERAAVEADDEPPDEGTAFDYHTYFDLINPQVRPWPTRVASTAGAVRLPKEMPGVHRARAHARARFCSSPSEVGRRACCGTRPSALRSPGATACTPRAAWWPTRHGGPPRATLDTSSTRLRGVRASACRLVCVGGRLGLSAGSVLCRRRRRGRLVQQRAGQRRRAARVAAARVHPVHRRAVRAGAPHRRRVVGADYVPQRQPRLPPEYDCANSAVPSGHSR